MLRIDGSLSIDGVIKSGEFQRFVNSAAIAKFGSHPDQEVLPFADACPFAVGQPQQRHQKISTSLAHIQVGENAPKLKKRSIANVTCSPETRS